MAVKGHLACTKQDITKRRENYSLTHFHLSGTLLFKILWSVRLKKYIYITFNCIYALNLLKVTKYFILFYNRKRYKINAVRFNFLITKNPKKGFSTTVFNTDNNSKYLLSSKSAY